MSDMKNKNIPLTLKDFRKYVKNLDNATLHNLFLRISGYGLQRSKALRDYKYPFKQTTTEVLRSTPIASEKIKNWFDNLKKVIMYAPYAKTKESYLKDMGLEYDAEGRLMPIKKLNNVIF